MDLKEIQANIDREMHEQNHAGKPDFQGYSPDEMHHLLYFTFGDESPIETQSPDKVDYNKIPILNQVRYLLNVVDKSGELKLTQRGNLPVKTVSDIYKQGFLKDKMIESGSSKLYKEEDSLTVHLTRILVEISGLVKKRNGKLSLTKAAAKTLSDDYAFLQLILKSFCTKFNWAYFDGYGENNIAQLGYGFSLILLSKFGERERPQSFYAENYFQAFPRLLDPLEPRFGTKAEYAAQCYSLRTFDRFLRFFGLVDIHSDGESFPADSLVSKTDLFDKLIKCKPHSTIVKSQ